MWWLSPSLSVSLSLSLSLALSLFLSSPAPSLSHSLSTHLLSYHRLWRPRGEVVPPYLLSSSRTSGTVAPAPLSPPADPPFPTLRQQHATYIGCVRFLLDKPIEESRIFSNISFSPFSIHHDHACTPSPTHRFSSSTPTSFFVSACSSSLLSLLLLLF